MSEYHDKDSSDYVHVYPIVRVDAAMVKGSLNESAVKVVKVMKSRLDAEAEVSRLSNINADKDCIYFWDTAKLK